MTRFRCHECGYKIRDFHQYTVSDFGKGWPKVKIHYPDCPTFKPRKVKA